MSIDATFKVIQTVEGRQFIKTYPISSDKVALVDITVPAAKIGQLTTRTSNTAGTLTMNAGHGIINGQRIDIFWTTAPAGITVGATVGTVSGNSVPFTLGTGDVLPANLTNVTVGLPTLETLTITGNDVVSISGYSEDVGVIVLADASTDCYAMNIRTAKDGLGWFNGNGVTNPVSAKSLTKIFMSHQNAVTAKIMKCAIQFG